MLSSRLAAHPRRTLIAVLLFVLLAGVLGGPVAGVLESSGGFVAPGADSEVAIERIQAATGREADPGVVVLLEPRAAGGAERVAAELRAMGLEVEGDEAGNLLARVRGRS